MQSLILTHERKKAATSFNLIFKLCEVGGDFTKWEPMIFMFFSPFHLLTILPLLFAGLKLWSLVPTFGVSSPSWQLPQCGNGSMKNQSVVFKWFMVLTLY